MNDATHPVEEVCLRPNPGVHRAESLEFLRNVPDDTFTAIATDPPYGLNFMGKGWDKVLPDPAIWAECLRVLKPGGHALIFGGTRTFHRLTCAVEDAGFEIRDCLIWMYGSGFPKSHDVSKAIDKAAGVDFESRPASGVGFMGPDGPGGYNPTKNRLVRKGPSTPSARSWNGYGTALKPAWEPIILARKPLSGTVAANCLEHGTGALNVDGCRIGTEGGRWPANVILDEEAAAQLDEQSGTRKSGVRSGMGFHGAKGDGGPAITGSEGGASRFFYCAKASKRDRNFGLPADTDEPNNHPTVKPIELMRYLVRLVKGPGPNLVLDPFAGSGSTAVACTLEGVDVVAIEKDSESAGLAWRRYEGAKKEYSAK